MMCCEMFQQLIFLHFLKTTDLKHPQMPCWLASHCVKLHSVLMHCIKNVYDVGWISACYVYFTCGRCDHLRSLKLIINHFKTMTQLKLYLSIYGINYCF